MSFKIFDDKNTKNYAIINKNHKEKTNLLENTNLTPEIVKLIIMMPILKIIIILKVLKKRK